MMDESARRRFEKGEKAPLTWDPVQGGKRSLVCFQDDKVFDLGEDIDKRRFQEVANRMVNGHYYPPDSLRLFGRFEEEKRLLEPGDRLLQRHPLLKPFYVWSMVEVFEVERDADMCRIGYVTTAHHHAKGIWNAELQWRDGHLMLRVWSIACPRSWLFWLGLPIGRYLQLRARRKAVEAFQAL